MQDTVAIYGAQRATLDLILGLLEHPREINVQVVLMEETRIGADRSLLREALHVLQCPFHVVPVGTAFSAKLVGEVRKMLKQENADILHTIGPKADFHGILASRWTFGIPVVASVHGWLFRKNPKERIHELLDSLSLQHIDQVVVLSRYYYDLLNGKGVSEDHLSLIPSGLHPSEIPDESRIHKERDKHKPLTVGLMGRLSSEKNHRMFLEAAEQVIKQHTHARFLIAGDGPDRSMIQDLLHRKKLNKYVQMVGYVDKDIFLEELDVLVICSKIENLPYVIMEAMSWGRPVIGTRVGGIPEMVDDGKTGYLVESDDAEALAERLIAMAEDLEHAGRLGRAGREKLLREFKLETTVQKHLNMYRKIVEG